MTSITSFIWERGEEFEKRFPVPCPPKHAVREFHNESIRKTLEVVREMCEGMKSRSSVGNINSSKRNAALSDLSSHLTEVLDKMNEV